MSICVGSLDEQKKIVSLSQNRILDTTDISPESQMNIITDSLRAEVNQRTQPTSYKSGGIDGSLINILMVSFQNLLVIVTRFADGFCRKEKVYPQN